MSAPKTRKRDLTGFGLAILNRFAGSTTIDHLGLRKPAENLLFNATKTGFRTLGATTRAFKKIEGWVKPARMKTGAAQDLFDITPTEDQRMVRDTMQQFALERLRPAAFDADQKCLAPADLRKECTDLGITLMSIPEDIGGAGSQRSAVTNVLIAESLAQGDMGLAVACLAPTAVANALVLWGTESQQSRYLPAFLEETPPAAALAIMEPRPLFDPFVLKTVARRTQHGFVLNGVKSLVPLAAQAELFLIAAHLENCGPALFLVESSQAGLSVSAEPAMGLRAASFGQVSFNDVSLPADALMAEGRADVYAECIRLSRLGWCALSVGAAQAALDYVIPYVKDRVAFGEPIAHRQSVAFMVANIGIELEGMRLITWRAASRVDQGLDFLRESALARRLCAERGMTIGNDAVQLLGGHGYVKEHPVERWYRDLRAVGLMEGVLLV